MNQPNCEKKQQLVRMLRQLQRAIPFAPIAVQLVHGETIFITAPWQFVVDADRLYVIVPPAKHVRSVPLSDVRRIGRRRVPRQRQPEMHGIGNEPGQPGDGGVSRRRGAGEGWQNDAGQNDAGQNDEQCGVWR
ncbi:hypothetical protein [Stieleria mannarensis]|uniref:hypothetical protein n=1 Tax=Stieleria mannarensis TaxID=2755585 RepID=UPI0016009AA6|nr:hypothetical protein [Rhodopirellula sp. JC639]